MSSILILGICHQALLVAEHQTLYVCSMTGSKSRSSAPTVKIRLDLAKNSNWRRSDDSISSLVFLAGQKVYGIINVKYKGAEGVRPGDTLQASFVGNFDRFSA